MVEFLKRDNAPDLAYVKTEAAVSSKHLPTIMFLGGFRSDMEGTKAIFLEKKCKERGQAYIRFDYRGHGKSKGKFEEACMSDWVQDAQDILKACTSGPVMLVGSSMGGWVSLLMTIKNPEHIHSIVGLAAAPDFTTWIEEGMSKDQKEHMVAHGFFELENDYDGTPYVITKKLIEDGRKNSLLEGDIVIERPVRLIQGQKDSDVAWQTAQRIKEAITGHDVEVILLEEADHRLSAPAQLAVLDKVITGLLKKEGITFLKTLQP